MGKQNLLHTTQPTQTPDTNHRNNKTNKPNLNFRSGGLERTEVGIIHTTSKTFAQYGMMRTFSWGLSTKLRQMIKSVL